MFSPCYIRGCPAPSLTTLWAQHWPDSVIQQWLTAIQMDTEITVRSQIPWNDPCQKKEGPSGIAMLVSGKSSQAEIMWQSFATFYQKNSQGGFSPDFSNFPVSVTMFFSHYPNCIDFARILHRDTGARDNSATPLTESPWLAELKFVLGTTIFHVPRSKPGRGSRSAYCQIEIGTVPPCRSPLKSDGYLWSWLRPISLAAW